MSETKIILAFWFLIIGTASLYYAYSHRDFGPVPWVVEGPAYLDPSDFVFTVPDHPYYHQDVSS